MSIKMRKSPINYKKAYEYMVDYLVNLEPSCSNCGSYNECCEKCNMDYWSMNTKLLKGIEDFRIEE